MKIPNRFLIVIATIIIFTAGLLSGASLMSNRGLNNNLSQIIGDKNKISITGVMIDTGVDLLSFPNIQVKDNDTVWSILERLSNQQPDLAVISEQYQDMGILIKSIKGFVNGTDGKYWQYWVNNKYADKAADKQSIKSGDVVMWKFTNSQYKEN